MTTLQASPKALSNEEATQKLIRLRGTVQSSEAAKQALRDEKKRIVEELERFAADEKARQKRERVPPTPQRLAKGDITNKSERAGIVAPEVQFQAKDHLDNVRKHLTEDEIAALARLIINMEYKRRTKSVTANYEGAGGGAYGPRHGGLPDKVRAAATIADWMLKDMHPEFQRVAEALAYGIQRAADSKPLSRQEIMALFFPDMGDKGRRDGGWIVLCRALCWRVLERERQLHAESKGETRQGLNHVRQIAREREA